MSYVNISGYKFTQLDNLEQLQQDLKANCLSLSLKGSILISTEGINIFLSGQRQAILEFYAYLATLNLPTIEFKESFSDYPPFKRMKVLIKAEIITMGVPWVDPANHSAPAVSAEEFKQWLDEKKPLVILDTRNQYEIEIGKFKTAFDLSIDHFREFPEAIKNLPEEFKNKTIVTYCTGGIRCEKAAPYLIAQGFNNVYQLEGGILKYLEKCDGTHYEGDCFVFDDRVALNAKLQESKELV
ncbi:MAG: rhodanese-related sulfurtransferase [Candidatus Berkiellales bacterium]